MINVDNAIILADGYGSRFVPITYDLPKGLVSVKGEPMIERQIRQLKEKGINEIIVVVGYLKEKFDYLIDKYDITLVFNPEFTVKDSLASLYCARSYLKNSYVLLGDNWMKENIFNSSEEKSWYSCVYIKGPTSGWCVKADRKGRIKKVTVGGYDTRIMHGPAFLSQTFSESFIAKLEEYYKKPGTENYRWESVYKDEIKHFDLFINRQENTDVYRFKTLEDLRQFDPYYYSQTPNALIKTIETVFEVSEDEIVDIKFLKAGMTNKSFGFSVNNKSYIFRQPGEGTETLIDRNQEREVYAAIKELNISDEVIYFDQVTGCKISEFFDNARNTSSRNRDDIEKSMEVLRNFHKTNIKVGRSYHIDKEINRYLKLCEKKNAIRYADNEEIYKKMTRLIKAAKKINVPYVLCHIDSNPDNYIRLRNGTIKIIDWEYSGMCDPILDISMYSIYSSYKRPEMDELLEIYLQREPTRDEKTRLYIYAALGGYLWALWTEYKYTFGVEFGDYGMRMYRYAKDYYKILQKEELLK